MNTTPGPVQSQGNIGRSILAVFAGFLVVVILSLGTDVFLHLVASFPKLGEVYSDRQFVWATLYRTFYGIVGSSVTAALAPRRPMKHALIGGAIGVVANAAGVVAALMQGPKLGPLWYPLALLIGTLPTAWLGAQLHIWKTGPR